MTQIVDNWNCLRLIFKESFAKQTSDWFVICLFWTDQVSWNRKPAPFSPSSVAPSWSDPTTGVWRTASLNTSTIARSSGKDFVSPAGLFQLFFYIICWIFVEFRWNQDGRGRSLLHFRRSNYLFQQHADHENHQDVPKKSFVTISFMKCSVLKYKINVS